MNTQICPTCHAPIPPHAPGGFCPACLLRDAEEPPAAGHAAPSLEQIAAAFPQFEVVRLIGQGGMGFVYQVRQPALDRTVALKILSPELGRDPAFAVRFAREARVLGKLNHPNIVTIFEHGERGGFFYLLMEYVDGVNLRQAMRAGRFTPEQALAIVPPVCDALQAAHAQGIWHRDIKPENILLDARGGVKIADFGIARIIGDPQRDFTLTLTGGVLGSAAYMAPEQHETPRNVDHRADIYSLGVVIYEMLTGELPLGRFPAPSQRAAVNDRIDRIVLRTLEKERELRQQSADEVKTEVENSTKHIQERASNAPQPARLSALFHGSLALLIGGGTVAAMGCFKAGEIANLLDARSPWSVIVYAGTLRATGVSPGVLVAFWPSIIASGLGLLGLGWCFLGKRREKRWRPLLGKERELRRQSSDEMKTEVRGGVSQTPKVSTKPPILKRRPRKIVVGLAVLVLLSLLGLIIHFQRIEQSLRFERGFDYRWSEATSSDAESQILRWKLALSQMDEPGRSYALGPVVEVILPEPSADAPFMLDFENGNLFSPNPELAKLLKSGGSSYIAPQTMEDWSKTTRSWYSWLQIQKVNVLATMPDCDSIQFFATLPFPLPCKFEDADSDTVLRTIRERMDKNQPWMTLAHHFKERSFIPLHSQFGQPFAFIAPEPFGATMGMVEVVGKSASPKRGLTIRYRLVKRMPDTPSEVRVESAESTFDRSPGGVMRDILAKTRQRNMIGFRDALSQSFKELQLGNAASFFGFDQVMFVEEKILDENTADVVVESMDAGKRRFIVRMIKEDGAWKVTRSDLNK